MEGGAKCSALFFADFFRSEKEPDEDEQADQRGGQRKSFLEEIGCTPAVFAGGPDGRRVDAGKQFLMLAHAEIDGWFCGPAGPRLPEDGSRQERVGVENVSGVDRSGEPSL